MPALAEGGHSKLSLLCALSAAFNQPLSVSDIHVLVKPPPTLADRQFASRYQSRPNSLLQRLLCHKSQFPSTAWSWATRRIVFSQWKSLAPRPSVLSKSDQGQEATHLPLAVSLSHLSPRRRISFETSISMNHYSLRTCTLLSDCHLKVGLSASAIDSTSILDCDLVLEMASIDEEKWDMWVELNDSTKSNYYTNTQG
ncbi:hypothetical protein F5141DRAFT_1108462, partial [Pisolithus sp. B1]